MANTLPPAPVAQTFLKPNCPFNVNILSVFVPVQEVRDAKTQMTNLTRQWYNDVRAVPEGSQSEDEEEETIFTHTQHNSDNGAQHEPLLAQ